MNYKQENIFQEFWLQGHKQSQVLPLGPLDIHKMADEIIKLRQSQDVVDRYIKESLLDIQLLEGIAKAMFDRNELYSVETYNWKGYTARLWNNQFPDVADYWVMLAQTALKEFYEKTNAY